VDSGKVSVHGPAAVTNALCFKGADRSPAPCAASAGEVATYSATGLGPREQVSIVASLAVSAFTNTAPDLRDGDSGFSGAEPASSMSPSVAKALSLFGYGGGLLFPLPAAALMGTLFWRRGRDEQYAALTPGHTPVEGAPGRLTHGQKGPVAVQFGSPKGVRPGLVGTIIDEEANTIDVSATVVDLAVHGYLRTKEVEPGSPAGRAVLAQSLGFKQYLVSAEARQIRFEEAQDIFSRYLPYAIVFGLADRWAGTFSEVAKAAAAAGGSSSVPGWYIFAGTGGFGNFAGIASGMDSLPTMASGTFTSTPGASDASGFGGGGFSGGRGGGGEGSSCW